MSDDARQIRDYIRALPSDKDRGAYIRGIVAEREAQRARRRAEAVARIAAGDLAAPGEEQ